MLLISQIGLWSVLYQVVKQQGRLLLRLDDLERAAAHVAELPVLNGAAAHAPPPGPAIGDSVAPFRLPDLAGRVVSLQDFLTAGQRVLLVHWSAKCGFCDLIAPDLAEHEAALRERGVQLVLISYGDPVANLQLAQQHGLSSPILIQADHERLDVFNNQGTPVACLVDAEGKVARPLAVGADAVPELVRSLISDTDAGAQPSKKTRLPGEKPLSESHIVRDGLKAGTPAPSFTLPDINGRGVSLEDFRGKPTVLVFSDPHCGPCNALAPQLAHIGDRLRARGVELVMVSRGDPEASREKARQHRFHFPVVLQQHWEVSKAFGIFATPVAFLIGSDGIIQRDVVQGGDAILALIQDQLEVRKEHRGGLAIR